MLRQFWKHRATIQHTTQTWRACSIADNDGTEADSTDWRQPRASVSGQGWAQPQPVNSSSSSSSSSSTLEWRQPQPAFCSQQDWRQRRAYSAQPALDAPSEEDVRLGAWRWENWWTNKHVTAKEAYLILERRLKEYGPQREKQLSMTIARIQTPEDADVALKAAELLQKHRAAREQHTPFRASTRNRMLMKAIEVGADVALVDLVERQNELGMPLDSRKPYRLILVYFSKKQDLRNVVRVFDAMRKNKVRPNRDVAYTVVRACLDCGHADLAQAYVQEFAANNLALSPAVVEQARCAIAGIPYKPSQGEEDEEAMGAGIGVEDDDDAEPPGAALPVSESADSEGGMEVVVEEGLKAEAEVAAEAATAAAPGATGSEKPTADASSLEKMPP